MVLIALGGNETSSYGSIVDTIRAAVNQVEALIGPVEAGSRVYQTPCFPAGAGPDYVNGALRVATSKSPEQVLELLHRIEADLGRKRIKRWGQRVVDLDLIAMGDRVMPDVATYDHWRLLPLDQQMQEAPQQLILPHPRVQDRSFVLVPLNDVAPDWVHPVLGLSVGQMMAARSPQERAEVQEIAGEPLFGA